LRSLTQIPEITAPHSLHPQTVQNSLFSGVWAPDENDAITINRVASQQVSPRTPPVESHGNRPQEKCSSGN